MEGSTKPARIVCSNLPQGLWDKDRLKKHFSQFGKVVRVHFRPKHKSWMIQYDASESAEIAILKGGKYMGQVFDVRRDKKKTKKELDPDWVPDPEVQKELEAMGSLGDKMFKQSYNLRPEGMIVDTSSPNQNFKSLKPNWKSIMKFKHDDKVGKSPLKNPLKKSVAEKINLSTESPQATGQAGLLSILKQPALTLEDKLRVLDARDKLIRLRTKISLDVAKANHLVGTCPDMCPEKERLMREIQHQVALYEQDVGGKGMNPSLAVKQYSRSSADQEVPLPHDLRPVTVLQLTMEYLMHHIMNLCDSPDVNIADWYYFLWDRTRSIRKDITQQALCCQGSVLLLEQCARFHIHCSARLVAEDISIFDPKINTENLTKCLQTLKYMYHDLHIKGEDCPNEAEFRAYIILLNLNDGNFMWEVQQLKREIQKSPEVRFALDIYSSLDKNNYVKFFKLVHSTTYLNACILLRYFVQVRTKALSVLVKCYSPRASYTQFSLAELEALLAFEDNDSVRDFVLSFGLLLNETGTHVILNKKFFTTPLVPIGLDRAVVVVESKRRKTVGEVVCGGTVSQALFEKYTPSNSFKENGIFSISDTLKNLIEIDHTVDEADTIILTKQPVADTLKHKPFWAVKTETPTIEPPRSSIFSTSTTKESGFTFKFGPQSSIFGGALFTKTEKPVESIFSTSANVPETHKQFSFGGVPLTQQSKIFETVPSTLEDMQLPNKSEQELLLIKQNIEEKENLRKLHERLEREKQQQLELEKQKQLQVEKQKQRELLERHMMILELEKQKQLEAERKKQFELEQKQLEIDRQRQLEIDRQRQLEIERQQQRQREEQKRIDDEKQQRIQRELQLKKQQEEQERERQRQILLLKEKERKINEEIKLSVKQLLDDLMTEVEENYKKERLKEISNSITKYKLRIFVKKWRNKVAARKKKRQAIDQNPIWVPSRTTREEALELFTTAQMLSLQNIKRYKLGQPSDIPLPDLKPTEKINIPQLYKILANSYAKLGFRAQTEMFWKITVSLPDVREFHTGLVYVENILTDFFEWKDRYGTTVVVDKHQFEKSFHYSIEKKQGVHSIDGNSNGLLFIINEITDIALQRIVLSIKMIPTLCRIPIACVIITDDFSKNNTVEKLKVTFEADKRSFNYTILSCLYNDIAIIDAVSKGLKFLTKCVEKPPPLELNLLDQFLQANLVTELWKKVLSYSTWSGKYRKCLKLPNVLIDLHNQAIEKLKEIITNDSDLQYQDFCDDFQLTNQTPQVFPCNFRYFPSFWKSQTYRQLLLYNMDALKLPKFAHNWPPETLSDLEDLLISYLSEVFVEASMIFYRVLAILLRNIDPLTNFCDIKKASWVDVVELLALEKIQHLDFSLRHTEFHTKSVFQDLIVVYDTSKLDAYNCDEWFYLKNSVVRFALQNQSKTKNINKKHGELESFVFDLDLNELENSLREESLDHSLKKGEMKSAVEELGTLVADLEESMKIHKSVCSHFQTTLTNVLSKKNK